MNLIRKSLRWVFDWTEALFGRAFPPEWNPILNLGALGFFYYWIVAVSGIYVYVFFDTGVHLAFESVEYMTNDQWYAAGVMRSLHRYASDALVVVMMLHMTREFALDRYRGVRWFSWATGVPVMMFLFIAGVTGYWLVWDKLAQYIALVTTEWLDYLPFFGEPIARNFHSVDTLESRFFTLMIFMHIAIPLIALILMWVHLQRVTKARINPPRGLAYGALAMLLVLSLVHPARSQGPANLAEVPGNVGLDWFYLPLYPLLERLPGTVTWTASLVLLVLFMGIPFLPPLRRPAAARVDLPNCNGCKRCFEDCPYSAITMAARSDGLPFEQQAVVNPSLCTSCGICAGACPTSTPFRRKSELIPGIDLPDFPMAELRRRVDAASFTAAGGRVLVFGCENGVSLAGLAGPGVAAVTLRCIGQLPPSFVDYALSKGVADGVVITGCKENGCQHRFGNRWAQARMNGTRDPQLRARVPRERVRVLWAGRLGRGELDHVLGEFGKELAALPAVASSEKGTPRVAAERPKSERVP